MRRDLHMWGCCLLLVSCDFFQKEAEPEAVARVGDSYLYASEIDSLVPPGTTPEDSATITNNFIDRWATRRLLMNAAEINLSDERKEDFNVLVRQYRNDLYTNAYMEEVVKTTVDTLVSDAELRAYYNSNKNNFRTNGTLVQLRYIHLSKDHPKLALIKQKFANIKKADQKFWETYQMQFRNSALNDSVWVSLNDIYKKLPFINPDNQDKYISRGMSFEKQDSLDIYLVKIKNVINKNEISPFEYLKPTLQQVILNRRKLELIKQFEKEITDDAIKNKKYEIYK